MLLSYVCTCYFKFEARCGDGEAGSGTDKHGDFSDRILCKRLPCLQRYLGNSLGRGLRVSENVTTPLMTIYAVAVKQGGTIVGHHLKSFHVFVLFLSEEGGP